MTIKGTFLHSKIGRRIFTLFICCSLVPIALISMLSFSQVMRNLEQQGQRRLQQSTKALGMALYERLLLLDSELRAVDPEVGQEIKPKVSVNENPAFEMGKGFRSIVLYRQNAETVTLSGKGGELPAISVEWQEDLKNGKTALVLIGSTLLDRRIYMVRQWAGPSDFLVGELDPAYLWKVGVENALPPMTDLCALDQNSSIIISSIEDAKPILAGLAEAKQRQGSRQFEWKQGKTSYIACYWSVFMRSNFAAPNWTVVLSENKAEILAPLDDFRSSFVGVILLSLLVVAFLSMYYIRQTLVPLEAIKDGIHQISNRNFDSHINVSSGDEFEEVAATFNEMSSQLGKQFKVLTTKAAIDRAILSSLNTERIISTVLTGIRGFLTCERISINLFAVEDPYAAISYSSGPGSHLIEHSSNVTFTPEEVKQCRKSRNFMVIRAENATAGYLSAVRESGVRCFLVLPVFVKDRLAVTVVMGYMKAATPPEDDLLHARQLADQMAVALANSSLIDELDQLNWGTLKALARTVDAKSAWTAGHSERVLELSMRIADPLGLSPEEKQILHRGALLHDIGKVGIPNRILDKPGRLNNEEYDLIKLHPSIGARILEPIDAYKAAIPIVHQHHERYDGTGYPHGLGGENIHLGARILTVADVFDAMLSSRPYRIGLSLDDVVNTIKQGNGRQFDPKVVEAFLSVLWTENGILDIWESPSSRERQMVQSCG
jgi:putative nucleotidyltransferase with HDIG domain